MELIEQGPEAAATRARLTHRQVVFQGEGGDIETGLDGPTACLVSESGTLLDFLNAADVDESDWRQSLSVRRFASVAELDAYVNVQPWREDQLSRGRDLLPTDAPTVAAKSIRFALGLFAGLSGSRVEVDAHSDGTRHQARSTRGRLVNGADLQVGDDEWARFLEELQLLNVRDWGDFGTNALDGLSWSLELEQFVRTEAAGCNSYPPYGSIEVSPEFTRCLLATERLIGRELWPDFPIAEALASIPDERDALEHAILSATRTWAAEQELAGVDPRKLTENHVERGLTPFLQRLTTTRTQVHIKGLLERWPGVGALDVELGDLTPPAWLELKWAKSANTLHNCLWDAAKLGVAQREGKASHGYLLAGAPDRAWERVSGPSRLFAVNVHAGASIVDDYLPWWKGWFAENEGTYPHSLATPIVTVPVGRVFLSGPSDGGSKGEPWTLRLARVHAPGGDFFTPTPRT